MIMIIISLLLCYICTIVSSKVQLQPHMDDSIIYDINTYPIHSQCASLEYAKEVQSLVIDMHNIQDKRPTKTYGQDIDVAFLPNGDIVTSPLYNLPQAIAYSNKHRFAYVHVHKVAGSSLTKHFIPSLICPTKANPKEYYCRAVEIWHSPPEYIYTSFALNSRLRSKYTFSFVRNPWSRHVSAYYFMKNEIKQRTPVYKLSYPTFEEYCYDPSLVDQKIYIGGIHHRPQYMSLIDNTGHFYVDFIGRLEHINEDFPIILNNLHIPGAIEHFKKYGLGSIHSNPHTKYWEMYNDETRALTECYYGVDILLFDYEFLPDECTTSNNNNKDNIVCDGASSYKNKIILDHNDMMKLKIYPVTQPFYKHPIFPRTITGMWTKTNQIQQVGSSLAYYIMGMDMVGLI